MMLSLSRSPWRPLALLVVFSVMNGSSADTTSSTSIRGGQRRLQQIDLTTPWYKHIPPITGWTEDRATYVLFPPEANEAIQDELLVIDAPLGLEVTVNVGNPHETFAVFDLLKGLVHRFRRQNQIIHVNPHYFIQSGVEAECRKLDIDPDTGNEIELPVDSEQCAQDCTNQGRYCLPSIHNGNGGGGNVVHGREVVMETLRRICYEQLYKASDLRFFEYLDALKATPCFSTDSGGGMTWENCALQAMYELPRQVSTRAIENCMHLAGGTTGDVPNVHLQQQVDKRKSHGINHGGSFTAADLPMMHIGLPGAHNDFPSPPWSVDSILTKVCQVYQQQTGVSPLGCQVCEPCADSRKCLWLLECDGRPFDMSMIDSNALSSAAQSFPDQQMEAPGAGSLAAAAASAGTSMTVPATMVQTAPPVAGEDALLATPEEEAQLIVPEDEEPPPSNPEDEDQEEPEEEEEETVEKEGEDLTNTAGVEQEELPASETPPTEAEQGGSNSFSFLHFSTSSPKPTPPPTVNEPQEQVAEEQEETEEEQDEETFTTAEEAAKEQQEEEEFEEKEEYYEEKEQEINHEKQELLWFEEIELNAVIAVCLVLVIVMGYCCVQAYRHRQEKLKEEYRTATEARWKQREEDFPGTKSVRFDLNENDIRRNSDLDKKKGNTFWDFWNLGGNSRELDQPKRQSLNDNVNRFNKKKAGNNNNLANARRKRVSINGGRRYMEDGSRSRRASVDPDLHLPFESPRYTTGHAAALAEAAATGQTPPRIPITDVSSSSSGSDTPDHLRYSSDWMTGFGGGDPFAPPMGGFGAGDPVGAADPFARPMHMGPAHAPPAAAFPSNIAAGEDELETSLPPLTRIQDNNNNPNLPVPAPGNSRTTGSSTSSSSTRYSGSTTNMEDDTFDGLQDVAML